MTISLETLGIETVNFSIAKAIHNKSTINITLSGDKFSIISFKIENEIKGQYLKIWSSEIKYIMEIEIGK